MVLDEACSALRTRLELCQDPEGESFAGGERSITHYLYAAVDFEPCRCDGAYTSSLKVAALVESLEGFPGGPYKESQRDIP